MSYSESRLLLTRRDSYANDELSLSVLSHKELLAHGGK